MSQGKKNSAKYTIYLDFPFTPLTRLDQIPWFVIEPHTGLWVNGKIHTFARYFYLKSWIVKLCYLYNEELDLFVSLLENYLEKCLCPIAQSLAEYNLWQRTSMINELKNRRNLTGSWMKLWKMMIIKYSIAKDFPFCKNITPSAKAKTCSRSLTFLYLKIFWIGITVMVVWHCKNLFKTADAL